MTLCFLKNVLGNHFLFDQTYEEKKAVQII